MVKIYSVNGKKSIPIGRVDDDGRVYNAIEGGVCVGAVNQQHGMIFDPPREGDLLGLIDAEGRVYDDFEDGDRSLHIGHTDEKGMVYDDSVDGERIVARVEGEPKHLAGAAFLLLREKLMNPLPF